MARSSARPKKIGRPSASDSFLDAPVPLTTLSVAEQARYHLALRQKGIIDPAVAIAEANAKLTADPVGWVIHRLGEHPWSKQRAIMESVRDHRYTMVPSCHGAGKSWLAARIAAWWLDSHAPGEAFVVTSAPTFRQVKAILWRELARAFTKGNLRGRMNTTEWFMPGKEGNEEMVAFGNKPSDFSPTAFQGIHQRYVLVIFDEACGIPKSLFDAASSLLTNEHCRMLAIGNPDDPTCEFADMSAPGSGCNVIHISAFDTPNFTGEVIPEEMRDLLVSPIWVNERKRKWGEDNPVYIAKVLGQFPETSESSLIPISAIKAAQNRTLEETYPCELGVDVGGGGDANVICRRRGPVARIVLSTTNPDTMQTLGNVIRAIKENGATLAKIDRVGIGHGACNRAEEIARSKEPNAKLAKLVRGIHVGQAAKNKEQYANLRAEGFWALRERFMDGDIDIDPNDDDLAAQLCALRTKPNSRGQDLIESKEDMKKRGKPSPDRADALMLAFLDDRGRNRRATWGRGASSTVMSPVDLAREEEKRRVRRAHRRPLRRA